MNFLRPPVSQREEGSKGNFRKPNAPIKQSSAAASIRERQTLSNPSAVSAQAGCSTLRGGGYRKKVSLKPGHSALDWHDLVVKTGTSKGLVTGLNKLLSEDYDVLQKINSPQSLIQLRSGVPPYLINPPLRINKEILKKHTAYEDCWGVLNGKVYSLTSYFDFHPGGVDILYKHCAGRDGTAEFNKYHRWVSIDKLLETGLVGVFVSS